jgi:gas vesicle protein GvpN
VCYLRAGYPVHFSGPTGTGKTALAFHLAAQLGRPVTLIHGDDEFGSGDLVGQTVGYRKYRLVDNYIHSVVKTEEEMKDFWVDNRLATACQRGDVLIYDEFNRSRPEANNALLSVLAEGILNMPKLRSSGEGYLRVHPEFRAIFTSNPEEYAGVHKAQDALLDRLVTIRLGPLDRSDEVDVTVARAGIPREDAETIVDVVRAVREMGVNNHRPTVRGCIAIARIVARSGSRPTFDDPLFRLICRDVLGADTAKVTYEGRSLMEDRVEEAVRTVCAAPARKKGRGRAQNGLEG